MEHGRIAYALFGALVLLALVQTAYYYPQMSDPIASHFDGSGRPDGWSSRAGFFGIHLAMVAMCVAIFVGLPRTFTRMPTRWISLPNRDYWLTPERREGTVRFLQTSMIWFGAAHMFLEVYVIQLVVLANRSGTNQLSSSIWYVMIGYFAFTFVWLAILIGRFARKSGPTVHSQT